MIAAILFVVFLFMVFSGYEFAVENPELANEFINSLFSQFEFTIKLPHYLLFLLIFLNNSIKSFLAVVLGVFFAIPPLFFVISNGALLGIVIGAKSSEVGLAKVLLLIVPHGVVEIPALILAASYGVEVGLAVIKKLLGKEIEISEVLAEKIKKYFKIVLPMLLVAALIETYVTPMFA